MRMHWHLLVHMHVIVILIKTVVQCGPVLWSTIMCTKNGPFKRVDHIIGLQHRRGDADWDQLKIYHTVGIGYYDYLGTPIDEMLAD